MSCGRAVVLWKTVAAVKYCAVTSQEVIVQIQHVTVSLFTSVSHIFVTKS